MFVVVLTGYDSPPAASGPQFTIPLRFHLLRTDQSIYIDTSAEEPQVRRWVERTNAVWRPARIRFEIEEVVTAAPRGVAGYDEYFQSLRSLKRERRAARREGREPPKRGNAYRWRDMLPLGDGIPHGIDVYVTSRVAGGAGMFLCSVPAVIVSATHMEKPRATALAT
jgi:hypothetical protein